MDRRRFLQSAGILTSAAWVMDGGPGFSSAVAAPPKQFKLAVISDGLSQDFEAALKILQSYQIKFVEIRKVWDKHNTELSPQEIRRFKQLLGEYDIRCSQVDTALFKCALPGTKPLGPGGPIYPYEEQMDLLKRAMERAHAWGTDKIRIFAFWRVADPQAIFGRVCDEVRKAAELAKSSGMRLIIENEDTTNVGKVQELAQILAVLPSNVGANYDTGNGMWLGEVSYPDGYKTLDPKRIWNIHLKGAECAPNFKDCHETLADQGQIDLKGQLQALRRDGYDGTMSLECEFKDPSLTPTETTKRSLDGLLKVMAEAVA